MKLLLIISITVNAIYTGAFWFFLENEHEITARVIEKCSRTCEEPLEDRLEYEPL